MIRLADKQGNYVDILTTLFPNAKLVDYTKKSIWQLACDLVNKFMIRSSADEFKAKILVSALKNN